MLSNSSVIKHYNLCL